MKVRGREEGPRDNPREVVFPPPRPESTKLKALSTLPAMPANASTSGKFNSVFAPRTACLTHQSGRNGANSRLESRIIFVTGEDNHPIPCNIKKPGVYFFLCTLCLASGHRQLINHLNKVPLKAKDLLRGKSIYASSSK